MRTNTSIDERARRLTELAKKKGLVQPHTVAFKIFPVEEEIHKGKVKNKK